MYTSEIWYLYGLCYSFVNAIHITRLCSILYTNLFLYWISTCFAESVCKLVSLNKYTCNCVFVFVCVCDKVLEYTKQASLVVFVLPKPSEGMATGNGRSSLLWSCLTLIFSTSPGLTWRSMLVLTRSISLPRPLLAHSASGCVSMDKCPHGAGCGGNWWLS